MAPTFALFVALGGTSYAVATGAIDSREVKNNTIQSKDVRNNDLRGKDVRRNTITGSDVDESKLGEGSISGYGRHGKQRGDR